MEHSGQSRKPAYLSHRLTLPNAARLVPVRLLWAGQGHRLVFCMANQQGSHAFPFSSLLIDVCFGNAAVEIGDLVCLLA